MKNATDSLAAAHGAAPQTAADLAATPFRELDHAKEALIAQATGGLSPAALGLAFADWFMHLRAAPGKQLELVALAVDGMLGLLGRADPEHRRADAAPTVVNGVAGPVDNRFRDDAWRAEPFRSWKQAFQLTDQWWYAATHAVPGATRHHEDVVAFCARQLLDMLAPANFPLTNPEVLRKTFATGGVNLLLGLCYAAQDASRIALGQPVADTSGFEVGVNLATTRGSVVFRNHLIELIQYHPVTPAVRAEPVLIVPAWIMKYYILDLSEHNSLIRYLVERGHTVFCMSWRNVDEHDRDLGFDDYRTLGIMAALDAIGRIVPDARVHATGYCLGGTLLAIAAAAMAHAGDDRLASVTLLAAQTDFTEPGELQLFIDESEVYFIESMMWARGYLGADQMASSFQLLQSNDLIWTRAIRHYLLGERPPTIDLMAWNADSTRMPYRMHSEYLRRFFLDNDLACARYEVDGRPVSLHNIRVPMFVVGTERDHIAPWQSVYKIHYLTDTDVTFVLTSGGHNAGIVSEPGHPHRCFHIARTAEEDMRVSAAEWVGAAELRDGSWWPAWNAWLDERSTPAAAPPRIGLPDAAEPVLAAAPGMYVLQRFQRRGEEPAARRNAARSD